MRLQQIEHRLPIVRGRLHHHPLDGGVRPGGSPARSTTGSSSNASTPPAGACFPGPGTRTQHTNSALPISRAATLAMICSSSWDSANIVVVNSSPALEPGRQGVVARGGGHTGKQNLIRVLDQISTAATMKGPRRDFQRPASRRPRRTIENHDVARRPPRHFQPTNGRPTRVNLARTLNLHWGLPHLVALPARTTLSATHVHM